MDNVEDQNKLNDSKKQPIQHVHYPQETRKTEAAAACLGEVGPGGVGAQQLALHVLLHPLQDAVLVQEVDLVFRGVHVDIHILRADF